jgi:hypothetical protein
MVRGLSVFQDWFKDFEDQYVLIGGTAAKITMAQEGLNFRGTKDLDIILHIELLTPEFGQQFWAFVRAGGYQLQEGETQKKPCLYRFQKPMEDDFPYMLELFSRVPAELSFTPPGHLTPIPFDEQISSLSAILLDEDYYRFVLDGRRNKHGLPSWVGEDRLIPLKAIAWMEMTQRVLSGEVIDSRKINKHLADVVQLSALLTPGVLIEAPMKVRTDMQRFARLVFNLDSSKYALALDRISAAFGLVR